ncbi:MAG: glycine--tRNA ligase subunit beta [Pseudomonadota bacterium]
MPDLLLELLSEEIPARMQARAAEDLRRGVTEGLAAAGLPVLNNAAFVTPRRLTLIAEGLAPASQPEREERRGPRTDAPEKAVEGFLRATGLSREALEVRPDRKGDVFFAVLERPGRPAAEIVAEVVTQVVESFPWPKSMRSGTGRLRWVRPLRSILCLLTEPEGEAEIVPFAIDGIAAGDSTEGHRFLAPGRFQVRGYEDYVSELRRRRVLLDPEERMATIKADAETLAFACNREVVADPNLLQEIAGLVEWPVTLMGEIDGAYLDLPPEVLQTSMREHQKFLSVRDPATGRIDSYITVANRTTADDGATILAGNGRVLAARLADAKFFWENDLRTVRARGMEGMAAPLAQVTFHNKLGSQAERIARIAGLARAIAPQVGAKPDLAAEAARICKADLASEMVYEFPELQGIMGRYYAEAAGHGDGVPEACEAHYAPLGPSDSVPTAPVSVAVALADKIDTLTGFWAIEERPTGSGDPYALRRAALGVIRILLEGELRLPLLPVFAAARQDADAGHLLGFFADRLKVHLRGEGVRHDVIDACFALGRQDDLVLLVRRVTALQEVLATEDGENLLIGYRRAANILAAEEKKDGVEYSLDPEPRLAEDAAEKALFEALDRAEAAIAPALEAEDFAAAMAAMAGLRAPVDRFFDDVTVNAEHAVLRRNRLCLLNRVRAVTHRVAILSEIAG